MIAKDADQKLRHFLDGLRPTLHRDVMLMRPAGYDEGQKQGQQKPQGKFRRPQQQRPPQVPGAPKPDDRQPGSQGNKFHVGRCLLGTFRCFVCGQEGHKVANCQKNTCSTTGRAYVMHAEETDADPDSTLITGRIYITGVATHALLDSGATHYFMSESFVKRLGIIPEAMDLGFRVSIPSGDQMFTSRIMRGLELRLKQKAVQRSVSVRPPSGKPFVFEEARHQQMSHVISCMCARKLINRGCQEFLASIVSVIEPVSQRLEDVDVVSEFSGVLPDDVSGIPPDSEVDFSIEIMPGTVPISKTPYRLAPTEMKELKYQIQDLLD
ncbi:uncharacterized protein [Primulina huaijiensis]|uniref:uncharacterized protein n=1 Tax=Primulina huaijiensis TaxID=1492673 RepID=UPI003CC76B99